LVSIIGLTVIAQTGFTAEVTDTYNSGDTLTAATLETIRDAVNDNDARISEIVLTPGPTGADGSQGLAGADGADGADSLPALPALPADNSGNYRLGYDSVSGTFSWENHITTYLIGDTGPAGGIVFYAYDYGQHGLEAAPTDQSNGASSGWGCSGTTVGGTAAEVGTGEANTLAINIQCGIDTAARIAADYRLNGIGGWYLPSIDELNLMWVNLADSDGDGANTGASDPYNLGGFVNYANYWSSTESNSTTALARDFSDGALVGVGKGAAYYYVRAVRSF
jgi:hypothetical protein